MILSRSELGTQGLSLLPTSIRRQALALPSLVSSPLLFAVAQFKPIAEAFKYSHKDRDDAIGSMAKAEALAAASEILTRL